jgi:hypothetical protein
MQAIVFSAVRVEPGENKKYGQMRLGLAHESSMVWRNPQSKSR